MKRHCRPEERWQEGAKVSRFHCRITIISPVLFFVKVVWHACPPPPPVYQIRVFLRYGRCGHRLDLEAWYAETRRVELKLHPAIGWRTVILHQGPAGVADLLSCDKNRSLMDPFAIPNMFTATQCKAPKSTRLPRSAMSIEWNLAALSCGHFVTLGSHYQQLINTLTSFRESTGVCYRCVSSASASALRNGNAVGPPV